MVIEAFQMLCPGCVQHGLPLAQLVQKTFPADAVQVLGLHSVFEHHAAMEKHALKAFAHEYRLTFPIAIDQPTQPGPVPATMRAWQLQGTPSMLIIGQDGSLVARYFGQTSELVIGAQIGALLEFGEKPAKPNALPNGGCSVDGCSP